MGVFDKMLDAMKLNDDDYDDDLDEEYEEEEEEKKTSFFKKSSPDTEDTKKNVGNTSRFTPIKGGKKSGGGMEVCVIKPTAFEDAREISETLLADRTVILNMEGLDLSIAQRIIDFISGSCYAIDGNLQKVSNFIFILTPSNVDISGDLQDIMNAFDFSGIKTGF